MNIRQAAEYAEIITSPHYAAAKNMAWEQNPDQYVDGREETEEILADAVLQHAQNADVFWEAKRLLALRSLTGHPMRENPMASYLLSASGFASPTKNTVEDLDAGAPGPVSTNSAIGSLYRQDMPAMTFLRASLMTIRERNSNYRDAIGPENYATSVKYFVDKVVEQDFTFDERSLSDLSTMLEGWAGGFALTAQKDKPNFVEMTNTYYAVNRLPKGVFPESFTPVLVRHSLDALSTFNRRTGIALLNAISRLDQNQAPDEMAVLVDLTVEMVGQFERTPEYRTALRAIRNLRPSTSTDAALRSVYANAYGLQEPLDLGGLREVSDSVRKIAERSIIDPQLAAETKEVAKSCSISAIGFYKRAANDPGVDSEQLVQYKSLVDEVVRNWNSI